LKAQRQEDWCETERPRKLGPGLLAPSEETS
jgi:hypothetical protein